MNRAERAHVLQEIAAWNKGVRAAAETPRLSGSGELELFRLHSALPSPVEDTRRLHRLNADGVCGECERRAS